MYPSTVRYVRATTRAEVLDVLAEMGADARVLAGGATLIPQMKYRQVPVGAPKVVVDISWLDELKGSRCENGHVLVGAMTRHVEAGEDEVLAAAVPGAHDVAVAIGDQQVRNMGTVGGGLAAVEPTGDWGPSLIAAGGSVRVVSRRGERKIAATDLFEAPLRSTVAPDELLTQVVFPVHEGRTGSAHAKLLVRAVTALGSCSVNLTLDDEDRVQRIGVGIGGLTPTPVAVPQVADVLVGQPVTEESVAAAKRAIVESLPSHSDVKTTAAHRRAIAGSLFGRALKSAHARATDADVQSTTRGAQE